MDSKLVTKQQQVFVWNDIENSPHCLSSKQQLVSRPSAGWDPCPHTINQNNEHKLEDGFQTRDETGTSFCLE